MASSLGTEAEERAFQWKDRPPNADDVGAPLDLGMEAFEWIRRVQLLAVLSGEGHVGQDVVLGIVHQCGELRHLGPELVGDQAPLALGAVGVVLGEGGGDEGGDDAPALVVDRDRDDAPGLACGPLAPVGQQEPPTRLRFA